MYHKDCDNLDQKEKCYQDGRKQEKKEFKLEAVIICCNYSDFLRHTLPVNKQYFNKLVVVTSKADKDTKHLCDFLNVECVQTDEFFGEDGKINKGVAINCGLRRLSKDGWVVQLDADIYLPPLTRNILETVQLDEQMIYGIDRFMCPNYDSWIDFIENPQLTHEAWIYIHTQIKDWKIGVRIGDYKSSGYMPIGFFQLWNPNGSGVREYPPLHGSIDRSDLLHAKKFDRLKRGFLPELICIHLDSEGSHDNEMGKNWSGRKTAPFGKVTKKEEKFFPEYKKKSFWKRIFGF